MLRSLTIKAAQLTPKFIKNAVHRNRFFDRLSRKAFEGAMAADGGIVRIESGPLAGVNLSVSEHVSHAHISGAYELETQRAIDGLVRPDSICYDLGASIGYLSLLMARKARQVYAFEPAPHAIEEIKKHAAANHFENIQVVPSPVSDGERTVEFSLTDTAYGSCITEAETRWPTLKLTTITLDDFAATHSFPDFIKIDVEGEEGRVLEGARSILREKKTSFCCELHSEAAARHVQGILLEYGYSITTLDEQPFQITDAIIAGEVQIIAVPQ